MKEHPISAGCLGGESVSGVEVERGCVVRTCGQDESSMVSVCDLSGRTQQLIADATMRHRRCVRDQPCCVDVHAYDTRVPEFPYRLRRCDHDHRNQRKGGSGSGCIVAVGDGNGCDDDEADIRDRGHDDAAPRSTEVGDCEHAAVAVRDEPVSDGERDDRRQNRFAESPRVQPGCTETTEFVNAGRSG